MDSKANLITNVMCHNWIALNKIFYSLIVAKYLKLIFISFRIIAFFFWRCIFGTNFLFIITIFYKDKMQSRNISRNSWDITFRPPWGFQLLILYPLLSYLFLRNFSAVFSWHSSLSSFIANKIINYFLIIEKLKNKKENPRIKLLKLLKKFFVYQWTRGTNRYQISDTYSVILQTCMVLFSIVFSK